MNWNQEESHLVGRAIQGNREAYGRLYEIHLDAIFQYVFYRVGHRQDAEDLTEAVFLKGWQAIGRYRQDGVPFRAWLYRIAHNTVVDHYRNRPQPAAAVELEQQVSRRPLPDEEVAQMEEAARLARLIRRLPELHQQVLVLRFVEGLSHGEVAQVIGKQEGAVRVLQHRALKALQALLALEETTDG